MKFHNERPRCFVTSCIVFLFLVSSATLVYGFSPLRIYTVGDLAKKADRIILVRYIGGKPELRNLQVVTHHRFRVIESIKGKFTETYEYYQAGGTMNGIDYRIDGLPEYRPGEMCVLFMESVASPKEITAPIGSFMGKFRVWVDKEGTVLAGNRILEHLLTVSSKNAGMAEKYQLSKRPLDSQAITTTRTLDELKRLSK